MRSSTTGLSSPICSTSGRAKATSKVLTGKQQRWGDYTGSQPDWNATGKVWVLGIYGRDDKEYGSYMAKLGSPFFVGVPGHNEVPAPSTVYPDPAWQSIKFQFALPKASVLSFVIYDARGSMVDRLLQKKCEAGRNRVEFNIASWLRVSTSSVHRATTEQSSWRSDS